MYLVLQVFNFYFIFYYIKMYGKMRVILYIYILIKIEYFLKNVVKYGYNEYGKNEFVDRGVCFIKLLYVICMKYVK